MSLRLPLSGVLLALAGIALADGAPHPAVPYAGLAVGVALVVTVVLDAAWLRRKRPQA
ncbi:MAG TPA: hypothetical protein VN681_10990 [Stellaceae bacterium]|nr:hypothetical protein [Stellaceae bacterium]